MKEMTGLLIATVAAAFLAGAVSLLLLPGQSPYGSRLVSVAEDQRLS